MDAISIAGGGLSGCLLLAGLKHRWPHLDVTVYEKSSQLCHLRTWSFHHDDIPKESWSWLEPFISKRWPGYDVFFPKYHRNFKSGYYSIRSQDLAEKIKAQFPASLQMNVSRLTTPETFQATGWPKLNNPQEYGYQKFVGLDVVTTTPHGLTQPILKDVRQPQTDGYRFFYVLPWSETELLIEDTYYSNSPNLEVESVTVQIHQYAQSQGWKMDRVTRRESGSLPLDLYRAQPVAHPMALGAAAGLAHPVTGYTLPIVVRQIQALLNVETPSIKAFEKVLIEENKILSQSFSYYRFLNRMMFKAADPEKRFKILQRFYTLPEGLIQRFYGGQTTSMDKWRILMGKPPVPVHKALLQMSDHGSHFA